MGAIQPQPGLLGGWWRPAAGGLSALAKGFATAAAAGGLAFVHETTYYDSNIDGIRKRCVRPGGGSAACDVVLVFVVDTAG